MSRRFAGQAGAVLAGTTLSYAAAFGISKVIAVLYGPSGVGLVGALMAFAALCGTLALSGQLNYLPVWAANHEDERSALVALSSRAVALTGGPVLVLGLVTLGVAVPFDGGWGVLAVGFVLLVAANIVGLQRTTLGSTLADPGVVARYQGTSALVMLVVTVPLALLLPLSVLPIVLGLGLLAGFVLASVPLQRSLGQHGGAPRWSEVRSFIRAGTSTLYGTVGNALVWTGLPVIVIYLVGSYDAGLFRSAWTIASAIWAVAASVLKVVYFPEVSRHLARGDSPVAYQRQTAGPVMVATAASVAVTSLAAPVVLHLLFSDQFTSASAALALLSLGGLARTWSSVNGFDLLARGRQRDFSLVEGASMLLLVVGVVLGSRIGGVTILAAAVALAFLVGAGLSEAVLRRSTTSRPTPCLSWTPVPWACVVASVASIAAAALRS